MHFKNAIILAVLCATSAIAQEETIAARDNIISVRDGLVDDEILLAARDVFDDLDTGYLERRSDFFDDELSELSARELLSEMLAPLVNRRAIVDTGGVVRCNRCGKTFANKKAGEAHKACPGPAPQPKSKNTCNQCGKDFGSAVGLTNHRKASGHQGLNWM